MSTEILFIYADDCKDCKRMRSFLQLATSTYDISIKEINSETSEAIDVAIEHGIEDIPGCVIGKKVFFGEKGFSYDGIKEAVKTLKEKKII